MNVPSDLLHVCFQIENYVSKLIIKIKNCNIIYSSRYLHAEYCFSCLRRWWGIPYQYLQQNATNKSPVILFFKYGHPLTDAYIQIDTYYTMAIVYQQLNSAYIIIVQSSRSPPMFANKSTSNYIICIPNNYIKTYNIHNIIIYGI